MVILNGNGYFILSNLNPVLASSKNICLSKLHNWKILSTQLFISNLMKWQSFSLKQDEDEELKINWRRVATTSFFGFGFVGPVGHFWLVLCPDFRGETCLYNV